MINFSKYKAILWDFDGVLMDSMPTRDIGFRHVLASYPEDQVIKLLEYHRANGGLSRYVKFRYFFETIRCESITEDQIMALASAFSRVMLDRLCTPELLIEDSLSFVRTKHTQLPMYVVSGSDGIELNEICQRLDLTRYFHSILGSPRPKIKLVEDILARDGFDHKEVILIGDSLNDLEAATKNQIEFAGYNNDKLRSLHPLYIETFTEFVS